MTETKPSGLLINLALIPFALVGILILGTCGAFCLGIASVAENPPAQVAP